MATLPALTPEELLQVLPCAACQTLSSFDDSLCLPYVRKDHDLAEILSHTVVKDVSNHPKRPANELISTVLNTVNLTQCVMNEMKNYGVAMKAFSIALNMNSASFSLALREPRHWFDTNFAQKKCYYHLYLWLNLPRRYRQDTLKRISDDLIQENPVQTLPKIKSLTMTFASEVVKNDINLRNFASKVLNFEDSITLRNMIMTPLPWEMMSWMMRIDYAKVWFWLKQKSGQRLAILGMAAKSSIYDTTQLAQQVLMKMTSITDLVKAVNPGLPINIMNSLLYNPVDWNFAHEHEKYVYLSLAAWLGNNTQAEMNELKIDAQNIMHSSMAFIRDANVTVTDFADQIVKIPRAHVSLYFNSSTLLWWKANQALRSGLINVCFWMDQTPAKRLERLKMLPPPTLQNDIMSEAAQIVQQVQESVENTGEVLDTSEIAQTMKNELRKAGISLKSFAKIVQINRNYFASLINTPLKWEASTKLQRFVYKSMKAWTDHRQGNHPRILPKGQARLALKPINGPQQSVKQKRVKFTPQQRQYLLEYFKTNTRPNHAEKVAISKHLGLTLRTVMIFFCNRRTRLNAEQKI